jgi:hypothetical protein
MTRYLRSAMMPWMLPFARRITLSLSLLLGWCVLFSLLDRVPDPPSHAVHHRGSLSKTSHQPSKNPTTDGFIRTPICLSFTATELERTVLFLSPRSVVAFPGLPKGMLDLPPPTV